ncbi:Transcriptional regulatory protein ZraR [Posidoniimonas polymericola]|uniref:Transcriptional regulatory protein ZraR n=2 Tax=Posidoniimonas polymericola TaxID=2528002 RepID=A0A5C5YQD9_9BACT|nr:Transcriptional regulatory protein ZraR [Posidoniimonas polymericola]
MWSALLKTLARGGPEEVPVVLAQAVVDQPGVDAVTLLRASPPEWEVLAAVGKTAPIELAAEALDAGRPCVQGEWSAAPLAGGVEVLLVRPAIEAGDLANLADLVGSCLAAGARLKSLQGKAERSATLLDLSRQWRLSDDLGQLLQSMADAACRLFDSDRASIFLWDSKSATLVGRPAIGIESGELRVPDSAGVVGEVLATGEPRRVSPGNDAHTIDHSIDAKTGYRTESLLAVPLQTASGEKLGVFELINKQSAPGFSLADQEGLLEFAEHASAVLAATQEFESLLERQELYVQEQASAIQLVGECPAIQALRSTVQRVADTDLSVLILGENGCGKEVVARLLHYNSKRRSAPFVAVNCAAIAETLLESELFGHEQGAFTDARETRAGKFELADGGALLLDEIGDMSLGGQAKLLRALEERKVVRVGGSVEIPVNVRVLAATNQDLAKLVREKRFREDLYFRLNVVTLELPPLRQRGDDLMLLADNFLRQFCRAAGRKKPVWTAEAKKLMAAHRWPGNVRELRNMMERLAYLSTGDKIESDDLAFIAAPNSGGDSLLDLGLPLGQATEEFQRRYIAQAIDQTRGNISQAAKLLGVFRTNLYRKMGSLGMEGHDAQE